MRTRILVAIGLVVLIGASPAFAQRRSRAPVPNTGLSAVGVSGGAMVADDPSFDRNFEVAGNLEGYVTPRVSIRGQVGIATLDIINRGFHGTVRPLYVEGNVVYNWERGQIHPYVTGGLGYYHYGFDIPPLSASANKFGADVGGGVEFFLHRYFTITGEGLLHAVQGPIDAPATTFLEPRFWSFRAGIKRYF